MFNNNNLLFFVLKRGSFAGVKNSAEMDDVLFVVVEKANWSALAVQVHWNHRVQQSKFDSGKLSA